VTENDLAPLPVDVSVLSDLSLLSLPEPYHEADLRDCQRHTQEEATAYQEFFQDELDAPEFYATKLAEDFLHGGVGFGGLPCPTGFPYAGFEPSPPVDHLNPLGWPPDALSSPEEQWDLPIGEFDR
jgi:hypothetical protein